MAGGQRLRLWPAHQCVKHTTHFVLARILTSGAANAEDRRCLGTDSVDSLKARALVGQLWAQVLFLRDDNAGPASEGIPNRHCAKCLVVGSLNAELLMGPVVQRGVGWWRAKLVSL